MFRKIAFSAICALAAVSSAAACSCIAPDPKKCGSGDVGLTVHVVSEPEHCGETVFFDVEVYEVIKNVVDGLDIAAGDIITVSSDLLSSCGYELNTGLDYLLYANPIDVIKPDEPKMIEEDTTDEDTGGDDGPDGPGTVRAKVVNKGKASASVKTESTDDGVKKATASATGRKLKDVPSVKVKKVVKDVPKQKPESKIDDALKFPDIEEPEEGEDEEEDEEEEEEPAEVPAEEPAKCGKTAVLTYALCTGSIDEPTYAEVHAARKACAA